MQISDILKQAAGIAQLDISSRFKLDWIYTACVECAKASTKACIIDTFNGNIAAGEWFAIPDEDFISILSIIDTLDDTKSPKYIQRGIRLKFEEESSYKIEYYRAPHRKTLESDDIELPSSFAIAVPFYVAAQQRFEFNNEDGEGERLTAAFYGTIASADNAMKNKSPTRIKPRVWR